MTEPRNGTDEFLIDLDAFAPPPGKRVKFRGKLYEVRNFNDIPVDDALLILRVTEEMKGKATAEQLELGLRYVAILIPGMDRATLGGLSANQVLGIMEQAMGAAEVPPVAGAAPSDSPMDSPSPAASTDGAGARSAS